MSNYEFIKAVVTSENPVERLKCLLAAGWLEMFIPELHRTHTIEQNKEHHIDTVFEHCIKACQCERTGTFVLRMAALLHDIGKASTYKADIVAICKGCGGKTVYGKCPLEKVRQFNARRCTCGHDLKVDVVNQTFYTHQIASTNEAKKVLKRLGVPKNESNIILHLIRHHMYSYSAAGRNRWKTSTVRRFIAKVGIKKEYLGDLPDFPLFVLREADRKSRGKKERTKAQKLLEKRITKVLKGDG